MTKLFLAAGVAALAISAPASAESGDKPNKGQSAKAERGDKARSAKSDRGRDKVRVVKADRIKIKQAGRDDDRVKIKARGRDDNRRDVLRIRDRDDKRFDHRLAGNRGHIEDCPPGLYRKMNGCNPPGQLKNGQRLPDGLRSASLPSVLRNLYRDNDDYYYRYQNNNLYRVDRKTDLISALLPLLGGGLLQGQMFPTSYRNSYVPDYYRSFYRDNDDDYYRYANGYAYEIDRSTGRIEDMIPMFANGYGVGQMLPPAYSYYNLPSQYRSFYPETDDHYYRYAPGSIYQVDRQSNLITTVASLLAGDLGVGRQLPMGYDAYNLPMAYRDRYADSADNWYRYNDGNIYQVDPTTRLITAVISALV